MSESEKRSVDNDLNDDDDDDDDDVDFDQHLLDAAKEGDSDVLQYVLEAGADVNSRNQYRKTACMLAAQNGHVNCVEMLTEAGADVNARGLYDKTALLLAVETGQTACAESLIQAGADVNECATVGHIRGKTTLMYAAGNGHLQCTELLIEAGADVNTRSKHNLTALMLAARHGHDSCVKALVEAGADVNHTDNHGNTTLMLLVANKDHAFWFDLDAFSQERVLSTTKLLLKYGSHVNGTNSFGDNALTRHIAYIDPIYRNLATLLFAAGETTGSTGNRNKRSVPEFLQFKELKLCLKHLCREATRKHLIRLNPHINLFLRIPQLGLPSLLTEYLLNEISLE